MAKESIIMRAKRKLAFQIRSCSVQMGSYSEPSFFVIGATKCGTTAIFDYLCKHPDIIPGFKKEINYFSHERHYKKGFKWYLSHFPLPCKMHKNAVTVDASTSYIYYPKCADRMSRQYPNAKMILLLRDPVSRAYSHWNMSTHTFKLPKHQRRKWMDEFSEFPTFEQAIELELNRMESGDLSDAAMEPSFIRRGLYAEQIDIFFEHFDREQLMIIESNELRINTETVLDDVMSFLGLRKFNLIARKTKKTSNVGKYSETIDPLCKEFLEKFYKEPNDRLYDLVGRDFGW